MNKYSQSSQSKRRKSGGFTLLEIMLALAIGVGITGAIVVGLVKASEKAKAGTVAQAISQLKSAVKLYADDHGGFFPVTESTTLTDIPQTGSTNATAALVSGAATVETVLFTDRSIDKTLQFGVGTNAAPSGSPGPMPWNNTNQTFTNTTATTWTNVGSNRVECFIAAQTATPLTATPVGSAFNLDGTNPLPAGKKVVTAILPNVSAAIAYQISKAIDGDGALSALTAGADANGAVIYAAPVAGVTTVYVYIVDL